MDDKRVSGYTRETKGYKGKDQLAKEKNLSKLMEKKMKTTNEKRSFTSSFSREGKGFTRVAVSHFIEGQDVNLVLRSTLETMDGV